MIRTRKPKANLPDRIVVGVDETGLADNAVRMAIDLGRRLGTPVELVHAVNHLPEPWPETELLRRRKLSPTLLAEASNAVQARLRPLLERASRGRKSRGPRAAETVAARRRQDHVRVVQGSPAKVILDAARGRKAAWILLGRHRRREILEFGSTLRAVFAKSSGPVWVQGSPVGPIKRILAPVDLSKESLSALATACALARVFQARVRAVYFFHLSALEIAGAAGSTVRGTPFALGKLGRAHLSAFERALGRFKWGGVEHSADFVDGEPVTKILQAARNADLVVLGSHGRSGLASVLLGGTAYAVLKRSKKPVLVVRTPGRKFLIP